MAYPSKIDAQIIVESAIALLESEGEETLTLRRLAKDLNVTANAIYRYFAGIDVLIAAVANAVARRLYIAIEQGMAEVSVDADEEERVRALMKTYGDFAERNPTLYRTFLSAKPEAAAELQHPRYHELLWPKVLSIIEPLTGPADAPAATVALWSLLHGIWALRQADVLGDKKPSDIDKYAFDALIRGLRR